MNNTQLEIIAIVFGFTFSIPDVNKLFLDYISPLILKESSNPTIPFIITLLYGIVFLASISGLIAIIKNIKWKLGISRTQKEFDNYMWKNVATLAISLIVALILKIRLNI